MNASPYLSDRVLLSDINDKPTPLPPGHIKQIIVANSPVTVPVYEIVEACNLPQGIMNQINSAQVGISDRQRAEDNLESTKTEIISSELKLATAYVLNDQYNTAVSLLSQSHETESKKLLAEIALDNSDFPLTESALTDVIYYSNAENLAENEAYVQLMTVLTELVQNNKTIEQIDNDQEQIIRTVANCGKATAALAQSILIAVFSEEYEHPVVKYSPQSVAKNLYNIINENQISETEFWAKLTPNPVQSGITLEYKLPYNCQAWFNIIDSHGKTVKEFKLNNKLNKEIFNNLLLADGIYYYQVICDVKVIITGKFVIIK